MKPRLALPKASSLSRPALLSACALMLGSPMPLLAQSQAPAAVTPPSSLAEQSSLFLKDVRLSGNTIFSADDLQPTIAPYLNRSVSAQEIQELRQKLTLYYVERGYINSGAVIPSQSADTGVIAIQIREGRLSDILVSGNDRLGSSYVADRIAAADDKPLNINALQDSLLKLKRNPLIQNINAHLKPGMRPGESVLDVQVTEARPYNIGIAVDNSRPPSIGSEHGSIEGLHRNLSGHGDSLRVLLGRTDGMNDGELDYFLPISRKDTMLGLHYRKNDAIVIEEQFRGLDITSKAESSGVSLRHPFYQTLDEEFALALKLEKKSSETSLLGVPFSFGAGPQNGVSKVTALRFSQEWLKMSVERVVSVRSTFSAGIKAFGATTNATGPDGRFLHWQGQFQWAEKINAAGDSLHFRTNVQLTKDPLLSLEKFAVGGFSTVRGYRENQLVRDHAVTATIEGRFSLPTPRFDDPALKQFQVVPFLDIGRAWNKDAATPDPRTIASVGVGLEWTPRKNVHGRLYYGHALRNIDNPGHDLQDSGIHFRIGIDLH